MKNPYSLSKPIIFSTLIFRFFLEVCVTSVAWADTLCRPLDEQPVKLEAWLSKKYRDILPMLRNDFGQMGNTQVIFWVYPADNPSASVAIGRCVPAFIARHILQKAVAFTKGVKSLVHQGFVHPHWAGIGTSLFSELSQKKVNKNQVELLLNENLSTAEFHDLYRRFTKQDKMVNGFGLNLPNPKLMKPME